MDSHHLKAHEPKELHIHKKFAGIGGYVVAENTNINGHPVAPRWGAGPFEAVEEFLECELLREMMNCGSGISSPFISTAGSNAFATSIENKLKVASIKGSCGYIPLTFAVPTYNRCSSVQLLVKAIQAQAKEEDEILFSDDGSIDQTFEELSKIPGIRLVRHEKNQGMVRNWNYCLEQARCDWICIIHDDDTLVPGGLEALRRACKIADQPTLILPTASQAECDESFRYRSWSPGAWSVLHCPTIPSGAVIHRKIVQELGGFNPKFCYSADLEYFPRIAAHFPVLIVDSPLAIRYELHDSNYQIKAWKDPECRTHLEEIQRLIVSYAGAKGEAAESLVQERLASWLEYIFREACRRDDQTLARQYAQLLGKRTKERSLARCFDLLLSLKRAFRKRFLNKC